MTFSETPLVGTQLYHYTDSMAEGRDGKCGKKKKCFGIYVSKLLSGLSHQMYQDLLITGAVSTYLIKLPKQQLISIEP